MKDTRTLRERLIRYFKKHHSEWIPKGEILRLVTNFTTFTPDNASRRLRELENDGTLEVTYRKNHAHYRLRDQQSPVEFFDSYPLPPESSVTSS